MVYTVTVRDAALQALIKNMGPKATATVDDSAHNIQQLASQLAVKRTGAMSQSIYVSTPNGSDYPQRASTARSLNPLAQIQPEVQPSNFQSISGGSSDGYIDIVGVAVEYGIFNELGTRYMAPRPYLFPAVEGERPKFIDAMSKIADV